MTSSVTNYVPPSHVIKFLVSICSLKVYVFFFQFSRANMSVITYNGYFQEYNLSIDAQNELSWTLGREFNLLTVTSDKVPWEAK